MRTAIMTLMLLALACGALADTAVRVYWGEWQAYDPTDSYIARANLDGSSQEILADGFQEGVGVKDLAIDQVAGKLYWANRSEGLIECSNLDGSARVTVITDANPVGLAIDADGGKIYWTDYTYSDPTIRRANLDGTDEEELWSCSAGCVLEGIALDPANGYLYWAERMDQHIYRGLMVGGWAARILVCSDGIGHPCGLAYHEGRIYWGGDYGLCSATEVGDDVQVIREDLPQSPRSMELDAEAGRLYWATTQSYGSMVQSCRLDGSDLQTHLEDLQYGYGLALELGEAVPVPDVPSPTVRLDCHPNPFNPGTSLSFDLPRAQTVNLQIHGLDGRLVDVLVDGPVEAGRHSVRWDGRDLQGRSLPSGVYLGRLTTGATSSTRRLTLVR